MVSSAVRTISRHPGRADHYRSGTVSSVSRLLRRADRVRVCDQEKCTDGLDPSCEGHRKQHRTWAVRPVTEASALMGRQPAGVPLSQRDLCCLRGDSELAVENDVELLLRGCGQGGPSARQDVREPKPERIRGTRIAALKPQEPHVDVSRRLVRFCAGKEGDVHGCGLSSGAWLQNDSVGCSIGDRLIGVQRLLERIDRALADREGLEVAADEAGNELSQDLAAFDRTE
jgi:hypothetical protein